jgi:ubiquinone/menaquinone biosynthesis C-methylase UbiE
MFTSAAQSLDILDQVVDLQANPLTVADFGSGTGEYVFALADRIADKSRIYAIDIQKNLLNRLATRAKEQGRDNIYTVWSDLESSNSTKIPAGSVDIGIVANTLFQIQDKQAFMAEIKRLLSRGSILLLIDWNDSFNNMGPDSNSIVTKDEAAKLLEDNGFTIHMATTQTDHHYAIVAAIE